MTTCTCGRTGHTGARRFETSREVRLSMAFDDQMRQKFIDWLNGRGIQLRCGVCGSNSRGYGGELAILLSVDLATGRPNLDLTTASGHPVVTVHCLNCAAVQLFDAKSAGLLS